MNLVDNKEYESKTESMYDKMISEADVGFGDLFKTALGSGVTSMAMSGSPMIPPVSVMSIWFCIARNFTLMPKPCLQSKE